MSNYLALAEKQIIELSDAIHDCIVDNDAVHGPTIHTDLAHILHHVVAAHKQFQIASELLEACEAALLVIPRYEPEPERLEIWHQIKDVIARAKGEVASARETCIDAMQAEIRNEEIQDQPGRS